MKINFNRKELDILLKATTLYEKEKYDSEDEKWQKTINNLIDKLIKER